MHLKFKFFHEGKRCDNDPVWEFTLAGLVRKCGDRTRGLLRARFALLVRVDAAHEKFAHLF